MTGTATTPNPNNPAPPAPSYEVELPPAVRAQVDRANQLLAEQQAANTAPVVSANDPAPASPAQQQAPPQPEYPQPQQAPPQQQPAQQAPQDDGSWQHRYEVLQGKYNNEVPRLLQGNRQLGERLEQMERLLATVQLATPEPGPASNGNGHAAAPEDQISDQEREEYGPELLSLIERMARATARSMVTPVQQHVQQVAQNARQSSAEALKQTVSTALDRWDPQWQVQNNDPAFLTWLAAVDHFSGQTRGILLQDAFVKGDARRVVDIFAAWRAEIGAVMPQPSQQGAAPPQPQYAAPYTQTSGQQRPSLDTFAAPGRGNSGPVPGDPGNGRLWTNSDIKRFFDDKTRGKFTGRDAEAAALEADIFRAQAEGRIRPNRPH